MTKIDLDLDLGAQHWELFDVLEVSIPKVSTPGGVVQRTMAEGLTRRSAEAVMNITVMRQGVEDYFYAVTGAGTYSAGEKWDGER